MRHRADVIQSPKMTSFVRCDRLDAVALSTSVQVRNFCPKPATREAAVSMRSLGLLRVSTGVA